MIEPATRRQSAIRKALQRGQGMTEYIIIVALIAIAGIVVFAAFGDVVRNQTAAMATELSGTSGAGAQGQAATRAGNAATAANDNTTLENYVGRQGQ